MECDLCKDLLPKNGGRIARKAHRRGGRSSEGTSEVKLRSWGDVEKLNPFIDPRSFVKYVRAFMVNYRNTKGFSSRIIFDDFSADILASAHIMDLLLDAKRDNKKFLDSWISYYIDNYLNGRRASDQSCTSFYTIRSTFKEFNSRFYIPK